MKKKLFCVLLVLIAAAVACLFYLEFHFGTTTFAPLDTPPEQILKEMPDVAVTPDETSMTKALSQTQEVTDAFLRAENVESGVCEFSTSEAQILLQAYIPRDWNFLELTVFPRSVYLEFSKGEEQSVYYVFDPTGEIHEKTIGVYGKNLFGNRTVKAIYCNQNGQITKLKEKRLWFEWLKR